MKKKVKILLMTFLLLSLGLQAQQVSVTGKVVEAGTGEPLPGVSIMVDKSTRGVTTDIDGTFEIRALPTDKLVFSFIGMENQTIVVGTKTYVEIELSPKSDELEEVTVVAMENKRKKV
ncbi:MAG: carboxypeptidase-like regulatory domain-containing protein [Dysgonamonadaceae bacterium]|nr:carboxypeptidase-like regulatory domain-containing protein [Dysgonamonadaceae bacterium]